MINNGKVGIKLSGFFRGKVISHLPCGRCKIWIPDVYPKEWADEESSAFKDVYGNNLKGVKIPDAEQATSLFGGGTSSSGSLSYPKINSLVWCFFEREDIQHPIYFASTIDTSDMVETNSFLEVTTGSNDGKELKHTLKCGKSTIVIDEKGTITLKNGSMASIVLGSNGNSVDINADKITLNGNLITIHSENVIDLVAKNALEITTGFLDGRHTGKTILSSNGSFQIHGKELNNNLFWI